MNLQDLQDSIDSRQHQANVLTTKQIADMAPHNPIEQEMTDQLMSARLSIDTALTHTTQS